MEKYTIDYKRGESLPVYFEPNEDFRENKSSMFRLAHIIDGNGVIKLNKETIILSAPAVLCLNELDEIELLQSLNLAAQSVYFNPTLINDSLQLSALRNENTELSASEYRDYFLIIPFIERTSDKNAYIEICPIASKRISQLFKSMKEELAYLESDYWPCRSRSFFFEVLFLIQNMITDSKNRVDINLPEPSEDISDIILYLHTNYDKKITIEELTDIFHINRTTLSANFRKSMGISIMEYLVKYRIKMAAVMLKDTMLPVSQILNRVGFKDSVHFSRMFKKHTGYTPSSYRNKYVVNNLK